MGDVKRDWKQLKFKLENNPCLPCTIRNEEQELWSALLGDQVQDSIYLQKTV